MIIALGQFSEFPIKTFPTRVVYSWSCNNRDPSLGFLQLLLVIVFIYLLHTFAHGYVV